MGKTSSVRSATSTIILCGDLESQLETIETKGFKILKKRVMPDHGHLFLEANPFDSPVKIMRIKSRCSMWNQVEQRKLREPVWRVSSGIHFIMLVQKDMFRLKE
ncbi:MAG: hypothetical protein EHM34_00975 [Nitrosopumilales archaeon]|jgi:REP element-mobilizing transposase RayT|nr:MAG: hypothetical protein EHM34_00975 [Nitrosopumilales archaeon]